MSTYDQLKARIANQLDDTHSTYADEIASAILEAIRWCERDTYYFNETRDITFSTVDGQQWYGSSDNANIPTLVKIQAAWSEDSDGQRTPLTAVTPEQIEELSDNSASTGEPYCYTYFGKRMRLYPVPGATVYTIRLQLGPYRLTALSAGSDTNVWTTDAEDMVVAYSKYLLYKNTLKDAALAAEAFNDYTNQDSALRRETTNRNGTGFIRATCF